DGLDIGVLGHRDAADGLGVGLGEGVGLLTLLGDADIVDHQVVAVHVQSGDQGVPLGLDELGGGSQTLGDGAACLFLDPDRLTAVVLDGVGAVGALDAEPDGAGFLDAGEDVLPARAAGATVGAVLPAAAGGQQGGDPHPAGGEGETTGGIEG